MLHESKLPLDTGIEFILSMHSNISACVTWDTLAKLPFVSHSEFIRSELSTFSAHVSEVWVTLAVKNMSSVTVPLEPLARPE